jgi:hypothetical protein
MSINAFLISEKVQFELPFGDDLYELESFLKNKGFRFNKYKGKFEYVYETEDKRIDTASWKVRSTHDNYLKNILKGKPFPFKSEICELISPVVPEYSYLLSGNGDDVDDVIKTLFNRKFEIVAMSKDGTTQIFKRRDDSVTICSDPGGKFGFAYYGGEDIAILNSFDLIL